MMYTMRPTTIKLILECWLDKQREAPRSAVAKDPKVCRGTGTNLPASRPRNI